MRILVITAALLIGLVGLLMSICGGGGFVVFAINVLRSVRGSGAASQLASATGVLLMSATCAVMGVGLCRLALKWLRGRPDD